MPRGGNARAGKMQLDSEAVLRAYRLVLQWPLEDSGDVSTSYRMLEESMLRLAL